MIYEKGPNLNFSAYRTEIEKALHLATEKMGPKTRLRDACEYALFSGGKRLRPILVLMIARALDRRSDAMQAALSVEFFHTSSLIADDLPCMDDDDERRGKPSLHKAFNQGIALLASYTLIASGYEGIYQNGQRMKQIPHMSHQADKATLGCLEIATRCAGIHGATNGQFLDLYPPDKTLQTMEKVILQKTITLFQISFVFGWLFGGGNSAHTLEVEKAAYHLGMAFQIADDMQDAAQDSDREGAMNFTLAMGSQEATSRFHLEMNLFENQLQKLGIWNEEFEEIANLLRKKGGNPPSF